MSSINESITAAISADRCDDSGIILPVGMSHIPYGLRLGRIHTGYNRVSVKPLCCCWLIWPIQND